METELVKVLQLKYPAISYTNKLYEGNKKTLIAQTSHRKTLKLLHKIKKNFRLQQATNLASLGKLLLLCDDNLNTENQYFGCMFYKAYPPRQNPPKRSEDAYLRGFNNCMNKTSLSEQ